MVIENNSCLKEAEIMQHCVDVVKERYFGYNSVKKLIWSKSTQIKPLIHSFLMKVYRYLKM